MQARSSSSRRSPSGVSRDDVYEGAELLGLDLDEHIANVIAALQPIAGELGSRAAA